MSSRKKPPDMPGVTKPRRQAASAPATKSAPKPKSKPVPRRALRSTRPDLIRCDWAGSDPLYVTHHDQEWGVPLHDDRALFEFLVLEGAQAGLSWITILRKRDSYHRAFAEFDPAIVARFGARDLERLLADPGIVRNRQKIEAAVANARAFLRVEKEFGSFDAYSWRFVDGRPRQNRWASLRELPAKTPEFASDFYWDSSSKRKTSTGELPSRSQANNSGCEISDILNIDGKTVKFSECMLRS